MKNAILVPGRPDKEEYYDPKYPTNSDGHWFPWLAKHLQINNVFAVTIEPPMPWQPRYDAWKKEFERFDITTETVLVGHSCGGGFLVRWLSENKDVKVDNVILIAPWLNPEDNPVSDTADFFHFVIDPNVAARTKNMTVLVSNDDEPSILKSVEIIKQQIQGLKVREFKGYGHFTFNDMNTKEFPELLQICLE